MVGQGIRGRLHRIVGQVLVSSPRMKWNIYIHTWIRGVYNAQRSWYIYMYIYISKTFQVFLVEMHVPLQHVAFNGGLYPSHYHQTSMAVLLHVSMEWAGN